MAVRDHPKGCSSGATKLPNRNSRRVLGPNTRPIVPAATAVHPLAEPVIGSRVETASVISSFLPQYCFLVALLAVHSIFDVAINAGRCLS
jgi:hypothetical protein